MVSDLKSVAPDHTLSLAVRPAIEHLVILLPPKERACVLLKDVFDYSLEETAELVGSSVGAVKSALKRGRSKLATAQPPAGRSRTENPELIGVLNLYVERFNRRDWEGLRELISADAQLRVTDAFEGRFADSPYLSNYSNWSVLWKLATAEVEGEHVVVVLRRDVDTFVVHSFIRLSVSERKINRIVDYSHCPWVAAVAERATRVQPS